MAAILACIYTIFTTLFPDESIEDVREASSRYEDIDLAACPLMSRATAAD